MKNTSIILFVLIALTISSNAQTTGWSTQTNPTTQTLYGVANSNSNIWVAVGDAGTIIRSSDSGITWTTVTSPVADALHGVSLHGNFGLAVGVSGRVLRSTNSGISWTEMTRPTTRILYAVSITDVSSIATGQEGTLLWSSDIGITWTSHTAGTASSILGVSANGMTAVGSGGQGAMVMSVSGGSSWGLTIIGNQLTFFYGVSFPSPSTGWTVGATTSPGYVIAKSIDGGFVWSAQTAPITDQLFGVSFAAMDTGTAVGGNGTIIHTVNSGTTWVNQTSGTIQTLNGVSFANTSLGIAVGAAGTILRTSSGGITGVNKTTNDVPKNFALQQNYPNPFNPSTKISYELPKNSFVTLRIFDILGNEVKELVNEEQNAGTHLLEFDGSNLSSGTYFYKLETSEFTDTKKMILLK